MRNEGQPTSPEQESLSSEQEGVDIEKQQAELVAQIEEAREAKDTARLVDLFGQLEAISLPPKEKGDLDQETIKQNQKLYDWLGLEVNLQQEYEQGNILLPTSEQKEAAEKEGYTLQLIIPGHLDRDQLINQIKQKYASEFNSEGIFFYSQAQQDLSSTQAIKQNPRAHQPYLILLNPQGLRDAHPDTMNKTFPQAQKILEQENQSNPQLNLKGLTLQEALMADAQSHLSSNKHLDQDLWAWHWLLEEQVLNESGKSVRCLGAYWYPDDRRVRVDSRSSESHGGDGGARFAAVPKVS